MERKKVIIVTLIFLVLSVVTPNNKMFFVFSFGYILALLWATRSIEKSFFYGFLVIGQFSVGQLYVYNIIPAEVLKHPLYPTGRDLYFRFTPALAMVGAMAGVVIGQIIRSKSFKIPKIGLLLVLSQLLGLISAVNSQARPLLSVLYALSSMSMTVWFLLGINVLDGIKLKKEKSSILMTGHSSIL